MKILTYTIQVTVPDDTDREQVTNSLNNALIYSQEAGAFWDDWNVGAVIPQGGEVTVPGDPYPADDDPAGLSPEAREYADENWAAGRHAERIARRPVE